MMVIGCKAKDKEKEESILKISAIVSKVKGDGYRKVCEWVEE